MTGSGPSRADPVNALLSRADATGAAELARTLLAEHPDDADVYNALGTALVKSGDDPGAERAYEKSAELDPLSYRPHANLAALLKRRGRAEEALAEIVSATRLAPDAARLHARRGELERDLDRPLESVASFGRAFELEPSRLHRDAFARASLEAGRSEEAARLIEAAEVTSDGRAILAHAYDVLGQRERLEDVMTKIVEESTSVSVLRDLVHVAARNGLNDLGLELADALAAAGGSDEELAEEVAINRAFFAETLGRRDEALEALERRASSAPTERIFTAWITACTRLRRYDPIERIEPIARERFATSVRVLTALGKLHVDLDRLDDAVAYYEKALELDPDDPATVALLSIVTGQAGWFERQRTLRERAVRLDPAMPLTYSFFFDLHDETQRAEDIRDRMEAWAERFGVAARTVALRPRSLDPQRRLRVAYLSPDFFDHAVMRFALPLLRSHDRSRFEVYCYANIPKSDRITDEIRGLSLTFREVRGLTPFAVAEKIAQDEIDIAIELAGYTNGSLLYALPFRPAPIQASYLGWPATTGFPDVDLRITDAVADPPGKTERFHTERLARLPHAAWCFEDWSEMPVEPRSDEGPLVFGSFNRASKLSEQVLKAWARILRELPDARLLLKGRTLFSQIAQRRIRAVFEAEGVGIDRVLMVGWAPSVGAHLASWGDVDIALDAFPYAGTTTTCEALWMGVPVVTYAGSAHISRVGASLLSAVGLERFVAEDWDGYVDRAVSLARDTALRRELRATLRERFRASVLGDPARFTSGFEALLREAFGAYAKSPEARAPAEARACVLEPRRWVRPSIHERETFVAFEQGIERDLDAEMGRALAARAGRVALSDGTGALAQALGMASPGADPCPTVSIFVPDSARRELAIASVDLSGRSSVTVHDREIGLDDASVADFLELDGASLARLLAASGAAGLGASVARVVYEEEDGFGVAIQIAQRYGLTVLRALPGLCVLVPCEAGSAFEPLARSFFVAGPQGLERLNVDRRLVRGPAKVDATAHLAREVSGSRTVRRYLDDFGLSELELPRSIRLWDESRRADLDVETRCSLLDLALVAAQREEGRDAVGGALTLARLFLETGARTRAALAVAPLLEREPSMPSLPFLPCTAEAEERAAPTSDWVRAHAIETVVRHGARSSFDRPRAHRRLLEEYFKRGGTDREMNRRLGLLLALDPRGVRSEL